MLYKIDLKSKSADELATELLYEVASARADGISLLLIDLSSFISTADQRAKKAMTSRIKRLLKDQKEAGKIQLYADRASFLANTTEAVYLLNKYSSVINCVDIESSDNYFYVKI